MPRRYNARMPSRQLTAVDRLLGIADNALRTVAAGSSAAARPNPAARVDEARLDEGERRHAAGLMRINHAGEVAAQALYQGHAVVARDPDVAAHLRRAADEERDHLAWCEQRLAELGAGPSLLSPAWYGGAFLIGAASGLLGDRWSLGFVAETERQVEAHLRDHLDRLPEADSRSRAIVDRMREEEVEHGLEAERRGGVPLPGGVRRLMRASADLMKMAAYRL